MNRTIYGFSGEKFVAKTVFIVKHKDTSEYIAVFSTKELAMNFKHNLLHYPDDEMIIQETILDYYAH